MPPKGRSKPAPEERALISSYQTPATRTTKRTLSFYPLYSSFLALLQLFFLQLNIVGVAAGASAVPWTVETFVGLSWAYCGVTLGPALWIVVRNSMTKVKRDDKDDVALHNLCHSALKSIVVAVCFTVYAARFDWKEAFDTNASYSVQLQRQQNWSSHCLLSLIFHFQSVWHYINYITLVFAK